VHQLTRRSRSFELLHHLLALAWPLKSDVSEIQQCCSCNMTFGRNEYIILALSRGHALLLQKEEGKEPALAATRKWARLMRWREQASQAHSAAPQRPEQAQDS